MNSFLVLLKIKESSFTAAVSIDKKNYSGNFKRVTDDIFHAVFKTPVKLHYGNGIEITTRNKKLIPVIPVFYESNKKKLIKVSKLIQGKTELPSREDIIIFTLMSEKALSMEKLREFFLMEKDEYLELLISMETAKKIKLMSIRNFYSCSYKTFTDTYSSLVESLSVYYKKRIKTLKFTDLAEKAVFHPDSLYFRYLLEKAREKFDFRILKDKIVFTELPLSEKEVSMVQDIEKIIKKNKLGIFSILNIKKVSGYDNEVINNSLWHMLSEERITPLDEKREFFIFSDDLQKVINRLKKFKRNQGEIIEISSFREISVLNRKNIILLLEYLDSQKITSRVGNRRKIELQV